MEFSRGFTKVVGLMMIMFLLGSTVDLVNGQSGKVFNIKNFGASGNGGTDNSKALLDAWEAACQSSGSSTVFVPPGTYMVSQVSFQGPCKGDVEIRFNGDLTAKSGPAIGTKHWISFDDVDGLSVTGSGTLNGQGPSAWPHNKCDESKNCGPPPVSLQFNQVKNAKVQGIRSVNSKFFHITINHSDGITLTGVTITAPGDSPNTDGVHVSNSNNVNIFDSNIATGDDCVSLGPGSTNVNIARVACGPGHGISIGSLGKSSGEADVQGIIVKNCTLSNTDNGLRIKTWATPYPSTVSHVLYQDIILNKVENPIIIDQKYCPNKLCSHGGESQVRITDVKFVNIRGTSREVKAVKLTCSLKVPCQGIVMNGVNVKYDAEGVSTVASCEHVSGTSLGRLRPAPCF